MTNGAAHLWLMRGLFFGLGLLVIFFHLLPLETTPRGWAGPDLMLAMTFAWVVRRPEYVPAALIALLFLVEDLLFHRPPGLWPAIVVLMAESLRRREAGFRTMPFPVEWATVAGTLIASALAYHIALSVFLVDRPALGLSLFQTAMTVVFYPAVVLISHLGLAVRKTVPGEVDTLGTRL